MKLNNHLIVTLPDFVRHFNYPEFWTNRRQFVRDMNPDRVYYWNDELRQAFHTVAYWISADDAADKVTKEKGIHALNTLLGGTLDLTTIPTASDKMLLNKDIVQIPAGQTAKFEPFQNKKGNTKQISLRLHKVEVIGTSDHPTQVLIGDQRCATLQAGDVAYITSCQGQAIEVLPNHLRSNNHELSLLGHDGQFHSTLVVQNLLSGAQTLFEGVTSFAIVEDGYIYIDRQQKPVFMTSLLPKFMLKHDGKALCVKGKGTHALIYYTDGTLRSTTNMNPVSGVYAANIEPSGKIVSKKI